MLKKCSKQPQKQNKHNSYFSLYGLLNVLGGGVRYLGQNPKRKTVIFFTPSLNPIETMSFPSSNNNEHIGKSRKRKPTCEADCLLIQQ